MNDQTILQRKAARETAHTAVELVLSEAAALPPEARAVYWEEVRKLLPVATVHVGRPRGIEPFSDARAKAWGRTRIPFGQYEDTPVDELPLDYLEFLAEPSAFIRDLRRYLASRLVQQEGDQADAEGEPATEA